MGVKKHYAWVICAVCFMMQFITIGEITPLLSVHMPFLKEQLGLTNAQTTMIPTVRTLSSMVSLMGAGWYYKRLSLRQGVIISYFFLLAGCLLYANAPSVWFCYLAAACHGITYTLGASYSMFLIINNWFADRTTTAMGICGAGSSICTMILPPVVTALVERSGSRTAYYFESAVIAVVIVILFLFLYSEPSEKGMEPYREEGYAAKTGKTKERWMSYPKGSAYIILLCAMFLIGISGPPGAAIYVIHYRTTGFSAAMAASAVSVYGMTMLAGKLLFGVLSDRFRTTMVNMIYIGSWLLGSLCMVLLSTGTPYLLYAAAMLNGVGVVAATLSIAVWSRETAPPEDFQRSLHKGQLMFNIGTLAGSPLPGIVADMTGSYAPMFVIYIILITISLSIVQFTYLKYGNKH